MEGYGSEQVIVKGTDGILKLWNDGLQITSCTALNSSFYIIMTKHTREYHENCRCGLLAAPGKKRMMKYRRDTKKEKLSLEYVIPGG